MEWLVTIHVLAAVLGIGPTYFGHILLRKKQRRDQLLQSLSLFGQLNYFPKIGGSLAVVSGILLVALTGWKFSDLWILGSLILYVLVQVVAVGMLGPVLNRLIQTLNGAKEQERDLSADSSALLARANRLYNTASTMGTILILLMIVKPM
ncbi:Predicted integral membrane protein [Paenibacillus sp. UNCCL117]|uniref:DUF2269 family protein n=1 Tax=unclassified Paenibacillus TaxID=185978 RepID=UPI00088AED8B|nr:MULTISPECIES: DUF2269 family protein [unclassified Paenibacillus]SDC95103.1 Predicted integral membrane protein [Paenibacillus sp. cl123]SFW29952.1 Predicted integral membrane protein [Paenibacillus sp. UNCCL117]